MVINMMNKRICLRNNSNKRLIKINNTNNWVFLIKLKKYKVLMSNQLEEVTEALKIRNEEISILK